MSSQPLVTTEQAADLLRVSRRTLEKWRLTGEGPKFYRLGRRRVVYRQSDLFEFVEGGARRSTSDPGRTA